jgi:hypothetical protein
MATKCSVKLILEIVILRSAEESLRRFSSKELGILHFVQDDTYAIFRLTKH